MGMFAKFLVLICCIIQTGHSTSDQKQSADDTSTLTTLSSDKNISIGSVQDDLDIIEEDFSFTCNKGVELLRFTLIGVIAVIISIIGIVSNILLFLVIYRQKYNQSTNLIIRTLAVVDSIILIIFMVINSIRIITDCGMKWHFYQRNYQLIFTVFYPIAYCIRTMSIWLATLLAIDRWQAMTQHQNTETGSRKQTTICKLICVICGAIIVSLPRFFEYHLDSSWSLEQSEMAHNQVYTIIYKTTIFFLSTYLIPMTLMILFSTKLILILKRGNTDSKKSRSITMTVIVIVLIFVACNLPPMVSHLIWSLENTFPTLSHLEEHRRPLVNVTNVLVVLNSMVNFFVYFCCSKSFRVSLAKLTGCQKGGRRLENSQSSTNISRCSSTEKLNEDTKI